jgi:hypothetical protein
MTDAKFIVGCAGPAQRWANHTGVPKHLVQIDGVPILHRTVSLLKEFGATDISILAIDERYRVEGTRFIAPTETAFKNTALGHSAEHWSSTKDSVVILGDVYFSEEGMRKIVSHQGERINWFGRRGAGRSEKRWPEIFAISIPPHCHQELLASFPHVSREFEEGRIKRATGWECYRFLHNLPMDENLFSEDFTDIDDETEDFDWPADYEQWIKKFRSTNMWRSHWSAMKISRPRN